MYFSIENQVIPCSEMFIPSLVNLQSLTDLLIMMKVLNLGKFLLGNKISCLVKIKIIIFQH